MKKFNEAFEYIVVATNGGEGMVHELNVIRDEYLTLLEIKNYLELALERKEKEYMILEDDYEQRIKYKDETINILKRNNEKLEKALDKTCELLSKFTTCPFDDLGIEFKRCSSYCENNEHGECWKEWCLRDERL